MRGRVWLAGAGLLALGGCNGQATEPVAPPEPSPLVLPVEPAAAAGGACRLLDFAVIAQTTGARFTVAVATRHANTQTCVLQAGSSSRPDLALSVTPTTADAEVFADAMVPKGAQRVKALGKAAYRITTSPGQDHGPGVEVGWLSGDRRLIYLRYTFTAGQNPPAAEAFAPKLVALAKKVDSRRL
ncbi:MAG TPA: hypothetical protein VF462_00705 [Micromonosporaceae bacterium]